MLCSPFKWHKWRKNEFLFSRKYESPDEFLARNSSGDNTSFLNTSILMLPIRIQFEYNFKLLFNRTRILSISRTVECTTTFLCWSRSSTWSSVKPDLRFVKRSKLQPRSFTEGIDKFTLPIEHKGYDREVLKRSKNFASHTCTFGSPHR